MLYRDAVSKFSSRLSLNDASSWPSPVEGLSRSLRPWAPNAPNATARNPAIAPIRNQAPPPIASSPPSERKADSIPVPTRDAHYRPAAMPRSEEAPMGGVVSIRGGRSGGERGEGIDPRPDAASR